MKEKTQYAKYQLKESVNFKEERAGVLTMRRHFAQYFKNLPNFRALKIRLLTASTYHDVLEVLDAISEKYNEY